MIAPIQRLRRIAQHWTRCRSIISVICLWSALLDPCAIRARFPTAAAVSSTYNT